MMSAHMPAMKMFPPGRRGVLLPTADRRAAALGVSMYTASRPVVLRLQSASYRLVGALGARTLPGRSAAWAPPLAQAEWQCLIDEVMASVGRFDAYAVYHRRQPDREGLTMLLIDRAFPLAVLKLRREGDQLSREQVALVHVRSAAPEHFAVPRALGLGSVGDWHWSAQSAVFIRPHRPELAAPAVLFDELEEIMSRLVLDAPARVGAHHDLTPWNLRLDHTGQRWLFDWEDWGAAPLGADRAYYSACVRALNGTPVPWGLSRPGIRHWQEILRVRSQSPDSDCALTARLRRALDEAEQAPPGAPATSGDSDESLRLAKGTEG